MSENTISLYVYKGGQGEITEKKSRFIATVRPVESEDEAVSFINETKKKYWDARHNCSAFVIGKRQELTRCSDDGEPAGTEDSDTEPPAEDVQEAAPEGYGLFVYAGPSLPHGRLKEHAVFNGTFEDVKAYLADVLEDYPQAERLIVPVERLSTFAAKVKTPGNIAHKYYNDIVSTMRGNKEV